MNHESSECFDQAHRWWGTALWQPAPSCRVRESVQVSEYFFDHVTDSVSVRCGSLTGLTANPQEAMLKPAALQILIEFAANESGQVFVLAGQFSPELGPILADDVVERGGLGAVAYVSCRRCWWCQRR